MPAFNVLIISAVRPSRTYRLAKRLTDEIGAHVCGIVQYGMQHLSQSEQMLVSDAPTYFIVPCTASRMRRIFSWFLVSTLRRLLWFIHGGRGSTVPMRLSERELLTCTADHGWPCILVRPAERDSVWQFADNRPADLIIVLGNSPFAEELRQVPRRALIRIKQPETVGAPETTPLILEAIEKKSNAPVQLASVMLPAERYDSAVSLKLKSDLISDDLLVRAAAVVATTQVDKASECIRQWVADILEPSIAEMQERALPDPENAAPIPRYRPVWKMVLETLVLCSPLWIVRNWYRRCRKQFPVLILRHHLISDRFHPMGMSTEEFWRHVRFLKRHYQIVGLSEAVDLLRNGRVARPTVCLTFDDGYGENFINLRAVAEEAEIPVAQFVATEIVDTHREFGHDTVRGIFSALPLTWDQICYWSSKRNGEFGSHTRTHFDCGSGDRPTLEGEIVGSKHDLEMRLGKQVQFFAFPYGEHANMCSEAIQLAAATYPYFVSSVGGENLPRRHKQPKHLLRKNHYPSLWELELELQSIFDLGQTLRRLLRLRAERAIVQFGIPAFSAGSGPHPIANS